MTAFSAIIDHSNAMNPPKLKIKNIYHLLDIIEPRPAMYLGDQSISALNAFLHGYTFSRFVHQEREIVEFPPFIYFNEWVMKYYGWEESTAGWKNIILSENGNDEKKSLNVFFELLAKFRKVHPVFIQMLKISEKSLAFHHSDECKIKTIQRGQKGKMKMMPPYPAAEEIWLARFSHSFGYYFYVLKNNKLAGADWHTRFNTQAAAQKQIGLLFNPQNKWQPVKGNLTLKLEKIFT